MSQAAQARDSWADIPTSRPRREAVSWASPEDLEVLGGLGEERAADWTVLTLERDDVTAGADEAGRDHVTERLSVAMIAATPTPAPARDAAPVRATDASDPGDGRRTVVIRGQTKPLRMDLAADRRRPAPRTRDRVGHRPDRVAMWAVMLGVLLIVVATMSAG